MIVSRESSPYTENSFTKASPRDFWSTRDPMSPAHFDENTPERSPSPSLSSPKRRSSIEKLKQSARVKNSNIFALESKDAYDPSSLPIVERPSANRPLSQQLANNSFTRFDSLRKENNPLRSPPRPGHKRSETEIHVPTLSPTWLPPNVPLPVSPEKQASPSPTKSSLARTSQFGMSPPTFDPENGTWSDDERVPTPRALHRHAKSVTFHEQVPEVHEYEQQTPEPSLSVASDREGSWDSDEFYDQDVSFDRGSSADVQERDDSFDADLENADKTPVVLPEDWTRMSPEEARTDLIDAQDDVFEGSPDHNSRPQLARSASATSDGETRPLPPLPAFMTEHTRRDSGSLMAAAERASQAARTLPSPPKRASCSKDEILKMTRESSLTLSDRLQLMSGHKEERPSSKSSDETAHGQPEELTITNLDTGEKTDVLVRVAEAPVEEDYVPDLPAFDDTPPKISRESILRKVRGTKYDFDDEDDAEDSEIAGGHGEVDYAELAKMDPDQPIQSRETSRENSDNYIPRRSPPYTVEDQQFKIKDEPNDDGGVDMAAIPEADTFQLQPPHSLSGMDDYGRQSSVLRHNLRSESEEDDEASHYSDSLEPEAESTLLHAQAGAEADDGKETLQDAMQLLTVKDYSQPEPAKKISGDFMGLPAYLSTGDFDFGMKEYITPSPPASSENTLKLDPATAPVLQPSAGFRESLNAPRAPYIEREVSPPGTPDSVIHRSSDVSSLQSQEMQAEQVVIPERVATIKTGGKLKARPSATPQDFELMAEQRRVVSTEYQVPAIPDQYRSEVEATEGSVYSAQGNEPKIDSLGEQKKPKGRRKSGRVTLDVSIPDIDTGLGEEGLGLDAEFERVIESQKVGSPYPPPAFAHFDALSQQHEAGGLHLSYHSPTPYSPHSRSAGSNLYTRAQTGYVTRQNTKVVVASNRNFSGDSNDTAASFKSGEPPMSSNSETIPRPGSRGTKSANSSPRKGSAEQFLKTEPWNGKIRRKSVRNASAQKSSYRSEPAPPLPGHESALGVVDEDYAAGSGSLEDEVADGVERGRLFVKVVGVKELDLPMPKNDRIYFQLTLDNGLHCVTTSSLELGTTAPIGQEFELVVLNDLEFQLTLTTKLPPPPAAPTPTPSSPTKSVKSQKSSGFSRFLSSPKKRAEKERQEREAAEAEERRIQEEARRKRASVQPTAWSLLHELVNGADGSFARAYINLKSHEKSCFGRPLTVDVPCYNEWALEKDAHVVSSVRSKRGAHAGLIRRPPYVVGQLELQLLYVPKPKGATDEDMPKSMSSAVREISKASEVKETVFEGHLSQQGGDCTVSSSTLQLRRAIVR